MKLRFPKVESFNIELNRSRPKVTAAIFFTYLFVSNIKWNEF